MAAADSAPRVLVAGGGIAGLETLLALRELSSGLARLTLLAPEPEFVYRPLLVREPFEAETAMRVDLAAACAELGVERVAAQLASVDPGARTALTDDGGEISYDSAVVCTGAELRPAYEAAATLWTGPEPPRIERLLEGLDAGPRRVSFIVPPGIAWALPLYEVALMTVRLLRERQEGEVELQLVTPESAPLAVFGPAASEQVGELLAGSGVAFVGDTWVGEQDGRLTSAGRGADLEGLAIALPEIHGRRIPGLPADEHGFLPVDEHSRVKGLPALYGAGDGTDFPVKQGGLATQQADAAAAHIARCHGFVESAEPFRPVLRGKLLTGGASLNMRSEIAGGAGEGIASEGYLWWPPHKVSGRYLAPWLAGESLHEEPEPPERPLEVEVAWPAEWHEAPMALDMLPPREPR